MLYIGKVLAYSLELHFIRLKSHVLVFTTARKMMSHLRFIFGPVFGKKNICILLSMAILVKKYVLINQAG